MLRLSKGLCLLGLLVMGLMVQANAESIPGFNQVKARYTHSDQLLFDRHGSLLQQVRTNWQQRQGDWLSLEAISPAAIRLLLYAEDRRFYEHQGVDWYAVAGTAWSSLKGKSLRGTSTISMQLVDLLGLGSGRVVGQRSWQAKWQQARLAQRLEKHWSKAQILEAYLNLVPFRGELIGVDAMARVLWHKQAFALSLPEAALAMAMLPSPNVQPERLQQRSCLLWRGVAPQADCAAQRWRNTQALRRLAQPAWGNPNEAPHAARFISQHEKKPRVHSSVDAKVQQQAQAILQRHLLDLKGTNATDAAVLVLHNATGEVLAYVGSSAQSQAVEFDHVQAKRQAGSTLKPFLYQLAIAQQRITAATLLADTSAQFSTPYGVYVPQNYDEQFMGWVSARVALAGSINIPAVRLLAQVGVDDFQRYLQQLGFELPYSSDYYGLGLALGGAEVSLWQLTNAYRSLANLGVYSPACFSVGCETAAQRMMPGGATWLIQHILADNTARAVTFGLDSALHTPFWSAVKTGTSKDMRDNWTVGFSTDYTVGVWVGNTDGSAMRGEVSGVSGAAPIWQDMMQFLQTSLEHSGVAPTRPEGLVCTEVVFVNHTEPSRSECFLAGTERQEVRLAVMDSGALRITAPLDNTIYAVDPDIPAAQQRVVLRTNATADDDVLWLLNGQQISKEMTFAWPLQAGKYRIELIHRQTNRLLDTVRIQVKP